MSTHSTDALPLMEQRLIVLSRRFLTMRNQNEFATFAETLPPSARHARFTDGANTWDIPRALWFCKRFKQIVQVNVVAVAAAHGWVKSDRPIFLIDQEAARDVDLTIPILTARGNILLDGHKRVYRALYKGIATLPCYDLTQEEEEWARVFPQ